MQSLCPLDKLVLLELLLAPAKAVRLALSITSSTVSATARSAAKIHFSTQPPTVAKTARKATFASWAPPSKSKAHLSR